MEDWEEEHLKIICAQRGIDWRELLVYVYYHDTKKLTDKEIQKKFSWSEKKITGYKEVLEQLGKTRVEGRKKSFLN